MELPSPHNRKAQLHPFDEAGTPFAKYFSIFWVKHRPISLMQSVKKDGDTPSFLPLNPPFSGYPWGHV